MKKNQYLRSLALLAALCMATPVLAQLPSNRIKPAVMYHAGDTVRSSRLGLTTIIPAGWSGVLPRDTEVFLLMPESNTVGEIFVMVNEKMDLAKQTRRWQEGAELSDGLTLKPQGEITSRVPGVISTVGMLAGPNANNSQARIYAEAKCSPVGFCVVYLATADPATFESVKTALQAFVDNTRLEQPSTESPYARFNWKKFLDNKILLSMGYENTSKRIDEVDLCADGAFRAKITRTGVFKDQAKGYQGTKKGTWTVKSEGEKATITFTFEKLPAVDILLEAKDEEIYIRGQRYFVGESQQCQQK